MTQHRAQRQMPPNEIVQRQTPQAGVQHHAHPNQGDMEHHGEPEESRAPDDIEKGRAPSQTTEQQHGEPEEWRAQAEQGRAPGPANRQAASIQSPTRRTLRPDRPDQQPNRIPDWQNTNGDRAGR